MYCLDTNVIIDFFRGDKVLAKKVGEMGPDEIFFTEITLCELFRGAYKSMQKEKSLQLIYDLVRNYRFLALTPDSCEIFGRDFNALARMGKPTQEFDLIVSSIAKENDLILVTRNRKHFENIPDLKLEEW